MAGIAAAGRAAQRDDAEEYEAFAARRGDDDAIEVEGEGVAEAGPSGLMR